MSLPIYVSYDSGITEREEIAILSGLHEALTYLTYDGEIKVFGADPWSEGAYSSADWYVVSAKSVYRVQTGHTQLDADSLLDLMANEPWQKSEPHIDVMFVSQDLTARDGSEWLNFVFGLACGRITVQSVARFRDIPVETDRYLAIKSIVQHELGHIFGMVADLNRSNTKDILGPHCTNRGCTMQQALSVPEWVQNARDAYQMGRVYCPQCLKDARRTLSS